MRAFVPDRFLRLTLLGTLAVLASLAATNWMLDPFGLFGNSFQRGDTELGQWPLNLYARIHKTVRMTEVQPATLIVGTSRAGIGLPASGWPWAKPAYNLAVSGASPREIRGLVEHAFELGQYEQVLVTLDFPLAFKAGGDELPDALLYSAGSAGWRQVLQKRVIGPLTLLLSHKTLHAACCGRSSPGTETVGRIGPDGREAPLDKVRRQASAPSLLDYWHLEEATYARLWLEVGALSATDRDARLHAYLEELRELFEMLARLPAVAHAVILPAHPWHLAVLREGGMWADYGEWLAATAELAAILPGTVGLLDYSGVDCVWQGDPTTTFARWFVDPSHMNPDLGREIAADVLRVGARATCLSAPARLKRDTTAVQLADLEAKLARYASEAPAEYAAAAKLARAPGLPRQEGPPESAWCRLWGKL